MADTPASDQDDEQPAPQAIEIRIEPQNMAGVWANFARVNHSEHEFTIDFVRLDYGNTPVNGIVVARVAVSPLFITQLIGALEDNWAKYAKKAMPKEVHGDDHT
jgi:hypothetical protein